VNEINNFKPKNSIQLWTNLDFFCVIRVAENNDIWVLSARVYFNRRNNFFCGALLVFIERALHVCCIYERPAESAFYKNKLHLVVSSLNASITREMILYNIILVCALWKLAQIWCHYRGQQVKNPTFAKSAARGSARRVH
jgi:hypothetical protein